MATLTLTYTADDKENLYALRDIKEVAYGIAGVEATYPSGQHYPTLLTLTGDRAALETVFRHFYQSDEGVKRAAAGIVERECLERRDAIVEDVKRNIANGTITDEEGIYEYVAESSEIIYTADANDYLKYSDNADAWEENIGGAGEVYQRASYALEQDVKDELGDYDDLFAELSPLSDEEKAEAVEYVTVSHEDAPDADIDDLIENAAHDATDNGARSGKIIDYLTDYFAAKTTGDTRGGDAL